MVCPGAMDIPGMELVGAGAPPHPARSMPTAARAIGHFRTVMTPFLSWVAELSVSATRTSRRVAGDERGVGDDVALVAVGC